MRVARRASAAARRAGRTLRPGGSPGTYASRTGRTPGAGWPGRTARPGASGSSRACRPGEPALAARASEPARPAGATLALLALRAGGAALALRTPRPALALRPLQARPARSPFDDLAVNINLTLDARDLALLEQQDAESHDHEQPA